MRLSQLMKPLSRLLKTRPATVTAAAAPTAVPAEAIESLPDGDSLRTFAGLRRVETRRSVEVERRAQARIASLIDAGDIHFEELLAASGSGDALLVVAGLCAESAPLDRAFAELGTGRISELVLNGPSSPVRQHAARAVEEPAELRRLLRALRGRDKNVYRIIKQKCDALNALDARRSEQQASLDALCASLERHSQRVFEPLYPASLRQFEAQWRLLEGDADAAARLRVEEAVTRCHRVIEAHEKQTADRAALAAQDNERRIARDTAQAESAEATRARLELEGQAAAAAAAANAQLRSIEEQERRKSLEAQAAALRQLNALLRRANGALHDGSTARAAGLRRAIEDKLPALPTLPGYVSAQLRKLDAALEEFKDWKEHAVAPKRLELIEAMEALVGSTETPPVLADRIRQLQEDWKTISLGVGADAQADWVRFSQASQTAYQPCRDYFESQALVRQDNLERRREVLDRLRAFEAKHSGETADWRAVATALREAPREWRSYVPVERGAVRVLQKEFDSIVGRLNVRLDGWYSQNAANKEALIRRAGDLDASTDSRQAMDAVKLLQHQWRAIGPARADQEHILWLAFREHCDAVYEKRQQDRTAYNAELEANKSRAIALCERVEAAAALAGDGLLEADSSIPQWRQQFEALGEMPRAAERGLRERFERSLDACHERAAQQRDLDAKRAFRDLLEASRLIAACAYAVDDAASLRQAAEGFIAGVPRLPKGGAEALQKAWAKANSPVPSDLAAREAELRMLCIRAEISSGSSSPAEDLPRRREYQVQRLAQRLAQGRDHRADDPDALALEWVNAGPASAAAHQSLFDRFIGCRPT